MRKELGVTLQYLREEMKLTQPQLGELLNVNYKNISVWERDKFEPSISTLIAYAKFFNVSVDYLLGIEKEDLGTNEVKKIIKKQREFIVEDVMHILKRCIDDLDKCK